MSVEELEIYDQWDMALPLIPERSYLYHLEPVGVGTPCVESLISYVIRLADAHQITMQKFIDREMVPQKMFANFNINNLEGYKQYDVLIFQGIFSLSSLLLGISALTQINKLEKLTLRRNLHLLTALSLARLIPLGNPFHSHRAWCPVCFHEWKEAGQVVYEPLLWSLKFVSICVHHRVRLRSGCPWCGGMRHNFLEHDSKPGCCSRCGNHMGVPLESFGSEVHAQDVELRIWLAATLGELLAKAPQLSSLLNKSQIMHLHRGLRSYIPTKISRKSQMLEELLVACYHSGISLLDLVTSEASIEKTEL